jgi:hypothetical protein
MKANRNSLQSLLFQRLVLSEDGGAASGPRSTAGQMRGREQVHPADRGPRGRLRPSTSVRA